MENLFIIYLNIYMKIPHFHLQATEYSRFCPKLNRTFAYYLCSTLYHYKYTIPVTLDYTQLALSNTKTAQVCPNFRHVRTHFKKTFCAHCKQLPLTFTSKFPFKTELLLSLFSSFQTSEILTCISIHRKPHMPICLVV